MIRRKAHELRHKIEQLATTLPDEEALTVEELFPKWVADKAYAVGDRVRHNDILYKCVQVHTSQPNWDPDVTPALWARVSIDEYPEWIQPTGAQDAYMTGDKVSHNEQHWVSTVDYNIWEPSVYGWESIE